MQNKNKKKCCSITKKIYEILVAFDNKGQILAFRKASYTLEVLNFFSQRVRIFKGKNPSQHLQLNSRKRSIMLFAITKSCKIRVK